MRLTGTSALTTTSGANQTRCGHFEPFRFYDAVISGVEIPQRSGLLLPYPSDDSILAGWYCSIHLAALAQRGTHASHHQTSGFYHRTRQRGCLATRGTGAAT